MFPLAFDWPTVGVTAVATPIILFLAAYFVRRLKALLQYLLDGLVYAPSKYIAPKLARLLSVRRLSRLLLSETDFQYLVVPSRDDVRLRVDDIFIPLVLEEQSPSREHFTHATLTKLGNRICVIGDPGSGKSSLVKRMFRDACRAASAWRNAGPIPFVVELRRIPAAVTASKSKVWLLDYVRKLLEQYRVFRVTETLDAYLEGTGVLLFFDGLDEVAGPTYDSIRKALIELSAELARRSEKNSMILTMRSQFYSQVRQHFSTSFPSVVKVEPFTTGDIFEFLARWPHSKDGPSLTSRVFSDLSDHPTLRELCTNPLILAMYVADYKTSDGNLVPESRTEFYRRVVDELLVRRRQRQRVSSDVSSTHLKQVREQLLGRIALLNLLSSDAPANLVPWQEALGVAKAVLRTADPDLAATLLRETSKETGLLSEERENESLRFLHLTICEYLAAHEVVNAPDQDWRKLLAIHADQSRDPRLEVRTRLSEIIPFVAGLLPRSQRIDLLKELILRGQLRLAGKVLLETKAYDHPLWPKWLKDSADTLCNSANAATDSWLEELRLFLAVARDVRSCGVSLAPIIPDEHGALGGFLSAAARARGVSLERIISEYSRQDPVAAVRIAQDSGLDLATDLAHVVLENCAHRPFLEIVRGYAASEPSKRQNWATLFAEAGLRSRGAAENMLRAEPLPDWFRQVEALPVRFQWHGKLVERNFFTDCLSICAARELSPFADGPGSPDRSSIRRTFAALATRPSPASRQELALWGDPKPTLLCGFLQHLLSPATAAKLRRNRTILLVVFGTLLTSVLVYLLKSLTFINSTYLIFGVAYIVVFLVLISMTPGVFLPLLYQRILKHPRPRGLETSTLAPRDLAHDMLRTFRMMALMSGVGRLAYEARVLQGFLVYRQMLAGTTQLT